MIACVTDAAANAFKTLHRTWINPDGTKAADPPRLWWPGLRKEGVCRLWPNDEVTHGLGIAEGIETALVMAAKGFVPVWAAMDAGNLAAFPVLAGIDALTIAVDHDPAGIKAAQAVGATWRAAGREVWAMFPQKPKSDLADAPWPQMEGLPDPEWERRVAEECVLRGLSSYGSSATVTEIVR